MEARLDRIDGRLEQISIRLAATGAKLTAIDAKLTAIGRKLDTFSVNTHSRLDRIEAHIGSNGPPASGEATAAQLHAAAQSSMTDLET